MRVLVVDDDELAIELIRAALMGAGYDVCLASNGEDALRILREGSCRLVVSDWRMPGMTGPELCRNVRAEKLPGYIYMILLTANDGSQQRIDGLAAGADDFIAKPFQLDELAARVRAGERVLTADRSELQAEITLRRLAEKDLIKHRQDLERINVELESSNQKLSSLYQTAQRFVDNVSHEFRTPLTVIKGYAEALGEEMAGPVNPQQKEFLGFVVDRARDLAQMVDDLLDSSKLRAGTLRVDRAAHEIEDILAPVRPMINAKAAGNKIELAENLAASLPRVFVDAEKAGRVIVNLVINAIKFSPEGGNVSLWARPCDDGGVEIGVTDHGPGISPENLKLIFDRFKQFGDPQNTTKGFGLGLNIARELVALNLGDITVASTPGKGSTFSFTLPPNDPELILRRYLTYMQMLPKTEPTIAVLGVSHPSEAPISADLRRFIASAIRATDLILEAPQSRALLLVGCTGDADRWVDRLRRASETFFSRLGPNHGIEPMEIEALGDWPYPLGNEQMWTLVMERLHAEVAYA